MLDALAGDVDPSPFVVAVATVEVVEDLTPPTINIVSPAAAAYDRCDSPAAGFSVADDLSGVASVDAWVDGAPIADGASLDMLFWELGEHTLAVRAFDKVGWEQNAGVTFQLQATIQGSKCALQRFRSLGLLDTNGIYTSINAHLTAADRALGVDKPGVARHQLESLLKLLKAQQEQIRPEAYRVLVMDIKALFIQHQEDVPPGLMGERVEQRGIDVQVLRAAPGVYPDPRAFDFVVPLGSGASAYDDDVPWIRDERAFLRAAIDEGVPVFGICFGSQILADVLGGSLPRSERPEIGWMKVDTEDPRLIAPGPWLVWHFDGFVTPPVVPDVARTAMGRQA